MLERIIYTRLYNYLQENKTLYSKQFGFQTGHSTDHAIIQLVEQIYENFEENKCTLSVFIDLAKAFDTVNNKILLRKMEIYDIGGITLKWFENYLANRKQYIQISNTKNTDLKDVVCGVPQGSILVSLLFLIYVNDLQYASNLLDPIMFADETNLFYAEENIKTLFDTVNIELLKISQWFISNKLSLNVTKTKYSFFHKPSKNDNIPLVLPKLSICNNKIKRSESIKFLGVFLDENLTCKDHIRYTENKISKNIALLFRSKLYLTKKCILSLYYSYIHTYISYANIAWGSTYISHMQLETCNAIRIIYKKKYETVRELLRSINILNVYQINILNNTILMHQISTKTAPSVFLSKFKKPSHMYPTRFSNVNYIKPTYKLNKCKFWISIRRPYLWNEKEILKKN